VLDHAGDRTITLTKIDALQDAPGHADDVVVHLDDLPVGGSLVVRNGEQTGTALDLNATITRLGRHPESEINLDDITVSRRHAEIERTARGHVVRDVGSLNGTYVNGKRIDEALLQQGDELQVGKFRLLYHQNADG
jgi:pSer/pThr/pTyr-binding forkhead associated (FHA) protein